MIFSSETFKLETVCGNMYVTILYDNGRMVKVVPNLGKPGTCAKAHLDSYVSLVNFMLANLSISKCIKGIIQSTGNKCFGQNTCVDQLGRLLVSVLADDDS